MIGDDPVTVATAAVGATSVMGAAGSVVGGFQAQSAANIQAQEARRQAALENQAAGQRISAEDTQANRLIAERVAATGASGTTLSGTRPALSEDFAQQRIKDMFTRYSGKLAASSDLYQASLASYEGKQALYKGIFGGAENLLQGAGNIAQIKLMSDMSIGS